ncbi:MAG: hypothetical protein IJV82_05485 [Oscillospiraceae bacterium]|nr:hypothetical protein [Oscillospiraceae bacterium]
MIDLHCHILPDIDDGAASLGVSLEMARMAQVSGVKEIAATPHFRGDSESLGMLADIQQRFDRLQAMLARDQIPIRLHRGAEVLCLPQTVELAADHQLPTLGTGNYVLTEFYFDESFDYMDEMLTQIAGYGYRIVVAHPERYEAIQRDSRRLRRWARQGFALQLNKGSILGSFGPRAERVANEIMAMGLAHLIASDGHGCQHRTPHMGAVKEWAEAMCQESYAKILLERNPRRILEGRPLVSDD